MDYRGHFENGMIRPDGPVNLPNGTEVEFRAVDRASGEMELAEQNRRFWANQPLSGEGKKAMGRLEDWVIDWPPDENIEDFLRMVREGRQ